MYMVILTFADSSEQEIHHFTHESDAKTYGSYRTNLNGAINGDLRDISITKVYPDSIRVTP